MEIKEKILNTITIYVIEIACTIAFFMYNLKNIILLPITAIFSTILIIIFTILFILKLKIYKEKKQHMPTQRELQETFTNYRNYKN